MSDVEAQGGGLVFGTTGGRCRFMVFLDKFKVKDKIVDGLTVGIDGPSTPELKFDHEDNGNIEVTWTPYAPGFYDIHVKFNGQPIKDSPFNVKIVGEVNSQGQYTPVKKQVTTGWAARQKAEKEIREKLKQQENAKSSNSSS